jgi:hypothetical protein
MTLIVLSGFEAFKDGLIGRQGRRNRRGGFATVVSDTTDGRV